MLNLYECPKKDCGLFRSTDPQCPICERHGSKLLRRDVETIHWLVPGGRILSTSLTLGPKGFDRSGKQYHHIVCDPEATSIRVEVRIDRDQVNCKECLNGA